MKKSLKIKFSVISFFARIIQKIRIKIYKLKGYDFDNSVIIERGLNLDRIYPQGIHIKANTLIASKVTIMSHDHCKRIDNQPLLADVCIGENCFIAVGSIILPGVTIGDETIVGAGAVVTKNIPSNCIVVGNPARIIRTGITMNNRAEWTNWVPKNN
ncbi:MAG TPA: acyltransferase [Bacteroidales bacterium]|nr:acyltransferase [Bacteroidales bacterium]